MKSKQKSSQENGGSKYSLDFLPEVESDVEDAFAWYELQRDGLGDEFLNAVEACIVKIRRNPDAFQQIFKTIRRALVRRFPFGVFFVIKNYEITVTAIVHLARHPKSWKVRKKS